MLVRHDFVSHWYFVDIICIVSIFIECLIADSISYFGNGFSFPLINACFILIYCNLRVHFRNMCFCFVQLFDLFFTHLMSYDGLFKPLARHDFMSRWYFVDIIFIVSISQNGLSADSTSYFGKRFSFYIHQRMFYLYIL